MLACSLRTWLPTHAFKLIGRTLGAIQSALVYFTLLYFSLTHVVLQLTRYHYRYYYYYYYYLRSAVCRLSRGWGGVSV